MSSPILYPAVQRLSRFGLSRFARVEVEGAEHLPTTGGALLLPNHQSALDPFVVQGWAPRRVRSMTKSTQFASLFMRWAVPRLGGFPVRRYRVDPQSVRTVLRLLDEGECVCIYPEGERTWDGRMQPFRQGTLRVALAAMERGHVVLPVGIRGMYDVLPRWGTPRQITSEVRVTFGAPLRLGPFDDRMARDRAIPALERALGRALGRLSGESERPAESWEEMITDAKTERASRF
jgi:1-acyl-sn-glycerol-3-phosphate acyltransferase